MDVIGEIVTCDDSGDDGGEWDGNEREASSECDVERVMVLMVLMFSLSAVSVRERFDAGEGVLSTLRAMLSVPSERETGRERIDAAARLAAVGR